MSEPEPESIETLDITDWTDDQDKIALRVEGNAMAGDHIADGDYVIIQRTSQPQQGKIVAYRRENGEFALRRYHRQRNGQIRFESSDGRARVLAPADTTIIGQLVGVVRKY